MSLSQKTIKAGGWQLIAVISKAVLQLIVLAILARYVRPVEFGLIAMANMLLVFVEMLAEAGIGPALIQRKTLTREHVSAGFLLSITLGLLFVSLLWGCAPLIASFFKAQDLTPIVRWIGLSVLITKISMVSRSLIEREMRFDILMWIDTASYIVGYAMVAVILALKGYGVWSIVIGKLVQCSIQALLLLIKEPVPIRIGSSLTETKNLLNYGGGLTLVRVFDNIASQGDFLIIGRFLGSALLGLYERAASLMCMPGQYLNYVLDKTLFPAMSQIQDQTKRLENAYFTATNIAGLILFPTSVLLITLAPEIIYIVLGPDWTDAVLPLQVLSVTLVFRIFINISDTLIRATGQVYASARRRAIYAVVILTLCWMAQFEGIIAVAVAMNVSVLFGYALMVQLSHRIVGFAYAAYFKIIGNGLLTGAILFMVLMPLVAMLRSVIDHHLLILCISGVALCLVLAALLAVHPRVLGQTGIQFLGNMISVSPIKFKRIYQYLSIKNQLNV